VFLDTKKDNDREKIAMVQIGEKVKIISWPDEKISHAFPDDRDGLNDAHQYPSGKIPFLVAF
jgi:hypothetical protein